MKSTEKSDVTAENTRIRPALTPEARENQCISLAFDIAQRQMIEGTASSQVITHFLKLGTELSRLEREKIRQETELLKAKSASVKAADNLEQLCKDAMAAMSNYKGDGVF